MNNLKIFNNNKFFSNIFHKSIHKIKKTYLFENLKIFQQNIMKFKHN